METRENLNRLLLENVLPAHVAALFVGENKKNEVAAAVMQLSHALLTFHTQSDTDCVSRRQKS